MLTRSICRAIGLHNLARILYWISLLLLLLGIWILIDPNQREIGQTVQVYITLAAFEVYMWLLLILARWQISRVLSSDAARSGVFALVLVGFVFIALNELYLAFQNLAYGLSGLIVILTLAKLFAARRWMRFTVPGPILVSCCLWILMLALPAPILSAYTEKDSTQHSLAYLFCWLVTLIVAGHLILVRWQMFRDRQKVVQPLGQWWVPWILPAVFLVLTVAQMYSVMWSLGVDWAQWYFSPVFLAVGVVVVLLSHTRNSQKILAWAALALAIMHAVKVYHQPIPSDLNADWLWPINVFTYYPFHSYGLFTCILLALGSLLTNQVGLFTLALLLPAGLGMTKASQQVWHWQYGKGIIMLLGAFILLGLGAVLQWLQENGRKLNLWLFPGNDGSGNDAQTNPIFVEDIPGNVKPPDLDDTNSDTQEMQPET